MLYSRRSLRLQGVNVSSVCSDVWGVERDTPIFIGNGEYENGIKKNE